MRIFGILCAVLALLLFTLPVLVFDFSGSLFDTVKSGVAAFSGDKQADMQSKTAEDGDTVTVLQVASGKVVETDTIQGRNSMSVNGSNHISIRMILVDTIPGSAALTVIPSAFSLSESSRVKSHKANLVLL